MNWLYEKALNGKLNIAIKNEGVFTLWIKS